MLSIFYDFPSVEWFKLLNINTRKVAIPAGKLLKTLNILQGVAIPASKWF